jgi:predicted dehydrogenase
VRTHFPLATQSLKAGKHTFLEKPMAASADQCKQLIDLAAARSLTLMVGHTFVYTSPVRKIKELIASGEIGEVMYISSRRLNLGLFQSDINVAWDLAPHDISIILHVLNRDPVSVNCQGKAHVKPNIEDVTNMTINFANGGIALIQSSWIDPRKVREITIVGSKKMIVYDDNEPLEKLKIYDKCVEMPPHYDTYAEFHFSYHYGDMYAPYLKQVEPLKVECQQFLDSIRSGSKSDSCGEEGLRVVQILEAATRSLKNGGNEVRITA